MPDARVRHETSDSAGLPARFSATRALSEALVAPLSEADATIQSMEDASPAKWHLAHTTWFWETFLLRDHVPGYRLYDESWPFLFNSYYEAEGDRILRKRRGMLSRPTLAEVIAWRAHVERGMEPLLDRPGAARPGRTGHRPRAAAPGTAADRHQARAVRRTRSARRCGTARVPPARGCARWLAPAPRRNRHDRARGRGLRLRQRRAAPPRAARTLRVVRSGW